MTQQDIIQQGLTPSQVEQSRNAHGANILTPPQRPSAWRLYAEKFKDPVIRILLFAASLSLLAGCFEGGFIETIGILFAILLATGIAFWFELDAAKKFDALNTLSGETPVKVVRQGVVTEVPTSELVVGDIVMLDAGDEVPADMQLIHSVELQVNESGLTGEPIAHKSTDTASDSGHAAFPPNLLLRSSLVVAGSAVARVCAVGDHTEIGKVARESYTLSAAQTPLSRQLDKLSGHISRVGTIVAVLAFVAFTVHDLATYIPTVSSWDIGAWIHLAHLIIQNFMMAVTLIVMAVPEGLPMAVTLSLALNMRRMLKSGNLVRKMHACETMGAVTVICTDKTGTLTQNRMSVGGILDCCTDRQLLAECIACNTTAHLNDSDPHGIGNPTEVALLNHLREQGMDYSTIRMKSAQQGRIPFSSERKYMATTVLSAHLQQEVTYLKGAPEVVLSLCSPLPGPQHTQILQQLATWQSQAMRTLALAYTDMPHVLSGSDTLSTQATFTLVAICAITDPIRQEVPQAISQCLGAGVQVKMVTGDSPATARQIALQTGICTPQSPDEAYITGSEFDQLTPEEAALRVSAIKVMSRARPLDKQRLVKMLTAQGQVVAVTGDGTNDAPALNHAHVGLSMGSGTMVAKEASDITLLHDSFSDIVTAIMWGRSIYTNIQRFILFQLTVNLTALLVVLIGAVLQTPMPLTVTQMLWVNIIMDTFAALALASLPAQPDMLRRKPRNPHDFIVTPPMLRHIAAYALPFVALLVGILYHTYRTAGTDVHELTLFFTLFVLLQCFNLLNASTFGTTHSVFHQLTQARAMLLVLALILATQYLIVQFGGTMFRTVPLTLHEWGILLLSSSAVLWAGEVARAISRYRNNRNTCTS